MNPEEKRIKLLTRQYKKFESYARGTERKIDLDNGLIRMITSDLEPFNVAQKNVFYRICQTFVSEVLIA